MFERVCVVVMDSVGIGELPDAERFGDAGSHTLGHIAERVPTIQLPNLQALGLGNIADLPHIPPAGSPLAFYGKMAETSVGKDTMTGHWELMGLHVDIPFEVYPEGFPEPLIKAFEDKTGRKVLCNRPASGTDVLNEYGEEQMRTGAWIVYTSADSVFQIAAHEDIIPLDELYAACKIAREMTLTAPYAVGRVIARPYVGEPGNFKRTANRHDYALAPPAKTVLNSISESGYDVVSVGKINDIFSGSGINHSYPTKSNAHGIETTIERLGDAGKGLIFTNLVDFDSLYGHRRDPEGYARCLEEFDRALPKMMERVGEKDLLIITADHGNDPIHAGTDHTREYVPILIYNPTFAGKTASIGVRSTFADLAATLAENFGVTGTGHGTSFLSLLTAR
ncbi:phosphopentomutase [Paenibacillus melissococcoides]|uniref:Phosphopentomutase n=1 Tax=Paenibacillus melissococcoides TaxID=2912268 RepID=A0ABN8UBU6_9BACL|nr:phosphopentomutase [Paenibacillus melissococcoides]CAH8246925.1 phosphopentomutase [Paenibacillus melissococcoides]CAH8716218.1 phosphopentomutase [Paenibacillus melissococcoides]CAH8717201.1 phosphopentomutase [Paenibacillus melissococcoides]